MTNNTKAAWCLPFSLLLLAVVIFYSCANKNKQSTSPETITISGSFALSPLMADLATAYMELHPNTRIHLMPASSSKGKADLFSGMTDMAMVAAMDSPKPIYAYNYVSLARDAVLAVINSKSPEKNSLMKHGLSVNELKNIFTAEKPKKYPFNVYRRSDKCSASEVWASFLKIKEAKLSGMPVYGDPGILNAVLQDEHAIAYCNLAWIYDPKTRQEHSGICIIPLDLNDDGLISKEENFYHNMDTLSEAIRIGLLPSPPLRTLFLLTNKENDKTSGFIEYVKGPGKAIIKNSGYIIPDDPQ